VISFLRRGKKNQKKEELEIKIKSPNITSNKAKEKRKIKSYNL